MTRSSAGRSAISLPAAICQRRLFFGAMRPVLAAWTAWAALAATSGWTARCVQAEDDAAKLEFFRKKVAPVLKEHCYECHSKRADEVKGDLLLDSQAALAKGGANGPAVVPGDVEASFLIRAIRYTEDDYKMPPRGKLDDDVIRDLERWIKDGANNNLPKESP